MELNYSTNDLPPKIWLNYDHEVDILYINFKKPSVASDSELTDDDIIIRYDDCDDIIGLTILHVSQRIAPPVS